MDNRERARARDKHQRRPISLEEKHKRFIAAVSKRGNASCHQGENERQREKNPYNISSIKRVIRKFLEVSRCSRAKTTAKKCTKKRPKLFFAN